MYISALVQRRSFIPGRVKSAWKSCKAPLLKAAGNVAVVVVDKLHAGAEPFAFESLAAERQLFFGDIEGLDLDAVSLGHVHGQCAPAAAHVEDRFVAAKFQLAADVIHFGHLGVFQRHVGRGEIRATVEHLAVEPDAIEVVAEVVVMVDIGLGTANGISTQQSPQDAHARLQALTR